MDMFFFTGFPTGVFSAPRAVPGGSIHDAVNLTNCGPQVIYEIYDRLAAAHPSHVTKQVMGEVDGQPINRYTFSNFPLENTSSFTVRPFKVCIITSIHGSEQGCAWTAAQFFRLMFEDPNDPHLGFLRRNVVFDVIPVANPWGFANNQRKNKNGVDLNRDYNAWFYGKNPPDSSEYAGPYPGSETETQVIMDFVKENLDAQVVLDYHNIGQGYPLFYVYDQKDVQLAASVFTELTAKWQREYPQFPKDRLLGRVRPNGHEGMLADYLIQNKLWVLTMETPGRMPDIGAEKYDAPTIRCALDVLVNTLLTLLWTAKNN
jgi:hypothetical protein